MLVYIVSSVIVSSGSLATCTRPDIDSCWRGVKLKQPTNKWTR